MNCSCCREIQRKAGSPPRELTQLPQELVSAPPKVFSKEDMPVFLCEFCDGDALEKAERAIHKLRKAS